MRGGKERQKTGGDRSEIHEALFRVQRYTQGIVDIALREFRRECTQHSINSY